MKRLFFLTILVSAVATTYAGLSVHPSPAKEILPTGQSDAALDQIGASGEIIDKAWSGSPVRFGIATSARQIYVGYYNADRQLTIAQRAIGGGPWTYTRLDTRTNWDGHRTVNMVIDNSGRLHIAANMHDSHLTYYMSDTSGDASSLKPIAVLVDKKFEKSITYPSYIRDRKNRLILRYRDGASGGGNEIYDVFNDQTATWSSLTPAPIVEGEGARNAYFVGPQRGPDNYFHMAWVWRETPDAQTNHDLTYARSQDLINWERSDGTRLPLPMRFGDGDVIDPVKVGGGIIGGTMGFDSSKRVMIAYHKYDANQESQIFLARLEGDHWHVAQVSNWQGYRWNFGGGGSISFAVYPGMPFQSGDDLIIPVTRDDKTSNIRIRASDLSDISETPTAAPNDPIKYGVHIPRGMILNQAESRQGGANYIIGWASAPPNRDRPRAKRTPPSPLMLFEEPIAARGKIP